LSGDRLAEGLDGSWQVAEQVTLVLHQSEVTAFVRHILGELDLGELELRGELRLFELADELLSLVFLEGVEVPVHDAVQPILVVELGFIRIANLELPEVDSRAPNILLAVHPRELILNAPEIGLQVFIDELGVR